MTTEYPIATLDDLATKIRRGVEKPIDFVQAANDPLLRVNDSPQKPSTMHRFGTTGVGGIVLENVKIGRRRVTSTEAIERFVRACSESATTPR